MVSDFISLSQFNVGGIAVNASASGVLFERGTASEVADGRELDVEGLIESTASGSILRASKVKFEDSALGAGEFEFKGQVQSDGSVIAERISLED